MPARSAPVWNRQKSINLNGIPHSSNACDIDLLALHQLQRSTSRVGNPYDNAKAEFFMKSLKQEEVDGSTYRNLKDLRIKMANNLSLFLCLTHGMHSKALTPIVLT